MPQISTLSEEEIPNFSRPAVLVHSTCVFIEDRVNSNIFNSKMVAYTMIHPLFFLESTTVVYTSAKDATLNACYLLTNQRQESVSYQVSPTAFFPSITEYMPKHTMLVSFIKQFQAHPDLHMLKTKTVRHFDALG